MLEKSQEPGSQVPYFLQLCLLEGWKNKVQFQLPSPKSLDTATRGLVMKDNLKCTTVQLCVFLKCIFNRNRKERRRGNILPSLSKFIYLTSLNFDIVKKKNYFMSQINKVTTHQITFIYACYPLFPVDIEVGREIFINVISLPQCLVQIYTENKTFYTLLLNII